MIESHVEFAVRPFHLRGSLIVLLGLLISGGATSSASAEEPPASESLTETSEETLANVSRDIEVEPAAADEEIASRLTRILNATQWFEDPDVHVDQGIVFLRGRADSEQHKQWASKLAGNTQDVVAVVNDFEVIEKSMWDLTPAWEELHELTADAVRGSPLIGIALLLLVATWYASKWSALGTSRFLQGRVKSELLRNVVGRAMAIPVFLLGLYLVLKVSGLTRLAMTVVGGTGLIGLVDDPEPLVLVEALGAATVNLRLYYWVDLATYSPLKVCSAIIRLTKLAFEEAGISMPDEAREVVFPAGVPVRMRSDEQVDDQPRSQRHIAKTAGDQQPANSAEGDLASEASEIQHQARQARTPEAGQNLLES